METIRTKLSRRRRKLVLTMVLGFLIMLFGMSGVILIHFHWFWVLIIGGCSVIMIPNFVLWFRMPCPLCGGNLGGAILTAEWSWKIK